MAVKGALLFEIRDTPVAIPLSYTESVETYVPRDLHRVGEGLMADLLGRTIPVVFLHDIWDLSTAHFQVGLPPKVLHQTFANTIPDQTLHTIIVSHEGRSVGLVVDRLLQQMEIVEKKLEKPLDNLHLFSGATILGNGAVCLVLDVPTLVQTLFTVSRNWKTETLRTLETSTVNS